MEYLVKTTQKRDFTPLINSTVYVKVPQQKNGYDCGNFLLQYVEMFLKVRSQFIQKRCKHGWTIIRQQICKFTQKIFNVPGFDKLVQKSYVKTALLQARGISSLTARCFYAEPDSQYFGVAYT